MEPRRTLDGDVDEPVLADEQVAQTWLPRSRAAAHHASSRSALDACRELYAGPASRGARAKADARRSSSRSRSAALRPRRRRWTRRRGVSRRGAAEPGRGRRRRARLASFASAATAIVAPVCASCVDTAPSSRRPCSSSSRSSARGPCATAGSIWRSSTIASTTISAPDRHGQRVIEVDGWTRALLVRAGVIAVPSAVSRCTSCAHTLDPAASADRSTRTGPGCGCSRAPTQRAGARPVFDGLFSRSYAPELAHRGGEGLATLLVTQDDQRRSRWRSRPRRPWPGAGRPLLLSPLRRAFFSTRPLTWGRPRRLPCPRAARPGPPFGEPRAYSPASPPASKCPRRARRRICARRHAIDEPPRRSRTSA